MLDVLVPGTGRPYLDGDRLDHSAPLVWTVPNVLTDAECDAAIARIEALSTVLSKAIRIRLEDLN